MFQCRKIQNGSRRQFGDFTRDPSTYGNLKYQGGISNQWKKGKTLKTKS